MMRLDHLTVMWPCTRCHPSLEHTRARRCAVEVEDVHGALVGPDTDPCRVAVEGNAIDFGPVCTSAELVQQFAGSGVKHADQGAFVRGGGAFGAVGIGHQTKEWAGVRGDDGDVSSRFGAGHRVFGRLCIIVVGVALKQG